MTPKANPRLNRIKIVSRIARWIVLVFFLFALGLLFLVVLSSHAANLITPRGFLFFIYQIIVCFWYWKLARLFRLYEHGQIFTAGTIRCIKTLGIICVAGATVISGSHFFPKTPPPPVPPGTTVSVGADFHIGFFSFDFGTGVDFGLIFSGIVIVLIAWIMDEGRKIQEEQELTV